MKSLLLRIFSIMIAIDFIISPSFSRRSYTKQSQNQHQQNPMQQQTIRVGTILPATSLITRQRTYYRRMNEFIFNINNNRYTKFGFTKHYTVGNGPTLLMTLTASPLEILQTLCTDVLPQDVISIIYFTNSDIYGSNAPSAQYFLQLSGYLGIPVIAWNPDNVGLEQRVSASKILQLAPSVEHQAEAMLSILRRYSWHSFSIVTSQIGGHDDFVRAIRDLTQRMDSHFKFIIIDIITLKSKNRTDVRNELEDLADSEARIILLFSTREEAFEIIGAATDLGLTGKNHVWIASQSVVGTRLDTPQGKFVPGMLGLFFDISEERFSEELYRALTIFAHGLDNYLSDPKNANSSLAPNLSCTLVGGNARWNKGDHFFKYLRNVTIKSTKQGGPVEFNKDGTLKYVELDVMNLNNRGMWEKIGVWTESGLDIKDIVWPGGSPVPPPGVPERFNLKVTFMEEPPYVNMAFPDNETGECKTSRSVRCRYAPESIIAGLNHSMAIRNPDLYRCCSGFCIDLLQNFAQDLKFTYDLYRVEDGMWGVLSQNGSWNGLISELLRSKADIVVTSIKINSERQSAVDFTVPFLETGISIVVAKRTGIISPKAFLEPFDTISWLMILLISIQMAAFSIFLFEWLSPYGYDMKMLPPRDDIGRNKDHKFSLFRTYWLVWAILFGAAVNVDCPRGYTARFMSNVWAMFAVVFLAIYTANLAAFMITREEYYDLSGIEDKRLINPKLTDPPFRYGTIPNGNTEAVLKRNKPFMYNYMKTYNRSSAKNGTAAVKKGDLDAFIYDATVLEYLVGQDNECRLLTVGTWYAMTGYGFALPKKSKYLSQFNRAMIRYRENGDLERLQRFWLQGACKPTRSKRNVSKPLDVNQFMSAFLLLGCGVLLTLFLLVLEHVYFRYIRKHLAKKDTGGCFTLISLSMGKSLSFRGAVFEATDMIKHHRCKDPVCDTQLWKTKHELDMARIKIQQLEAELLGRDATKTPLSSPPPLPQLPDDKGSWMLEILKHRDLTRNYITSNEPPPADLPPSYKTHPLHPYGPHFFKPIQSEIAEIETVL